MAGGVVILFGPSSSGKTFFYNNIKKKNEADKKKSIVWKKDGWDEECDRMDEIRELNGMKDGARKKHEWQRNGYSINYARFDYVLESHKKIIAANPESFRDFQYLVKYFNDELEVLGAIFSGKLIALNSELSLLEEVDVNEFIDKLSLQEKEKYNKEIIEGLKKLAKNHNKAFKEANKGLSIESQMELNIYKRVMENSKNNLPTILDFTQYHVVLGLIKYMKDHNFLCPLFIAMVHCGISDLFRHMIKRNEEAKGDERKLRTRFFLSDNI